MAVNVLPLSTYGRPLFLWLHSHSHKIQSLQSPTSIRIQAYPPRGTLFLLPSSSISLLPLLGSSAAAQKSKDGQGIDELHGYGGLPKEFFDDEWQARQRQKTREWHAYRQKEEEKENRKDDEYLEIGMRLKGYPEEEVREARKLVSSFIRAEEEVEEVGCGLIVAETMMESMFMLALHVDPLINFRVALGKKIEEAAERGDLTELVLMVIWNRLDLARRDGEKDVIRSLDLLYRRIETQILKMEATPSMRLLDELLNLYDGQDIEGWLKKCRKRMIDTFPREDPYSMLVPTGFDINSHEGRFKLPSEADDLLLRVDFVREVHELLQEVKAEQSGISTPHSLDPTSVAARLKVQERQQIIHQVETVLELASALKW